MSKPPSGRRTFSFVSRSPKGADLAVEHVSTRCRSDPVEGDAAGLIDRVGDRQLIAENEAQDRQTDLGGAVEVDSRRA
jgi:hypothetical protein